MIRGYKDEDYRPLRELYGHTEWYGGTFNEARDGRERLAEKIAADPEAILVFERGGELLGTISLIEDGRVAWLYRFVVKDMDLAITRQLYDKAINILKFRGHTQALVYSPVDDKALAGRYDALDMAKGGTYTCFWQEI